MNQVTMNFWLRRAFVQFQEKNQDQPWPVKINGDQFLIHHIHSDFLLGKVPGYDELALLPFSVIQSIVVSQ